MTHSSKLLLLSLLILAAPCATLHAAAEADAFVPSESDADVVESAPPLPRSAQEIAGPELDGLMRKTFGYLESSKDIMKNGLTKRNIQGLLDTYQQVRNDREKDHSLSPGDKHPLIKVFTLLQDVPDADSNPRSVGTLNLIYQDLCPKRFAQRLIQANDLNADIVLASSSYSTFREDASYLWIERADKKAEEAETAALKEQELQQREQRRQARIAEYDEYIAPRAALSAKRRGERALALARHKLSELTFDDRIHADRPDCLLVSNDGQEPA